MNEIKNSCDSELERSSQKLQQLSMELDFKANEVYRCKEEIAELRGKSSGDTSAYKQRINELNLTIDDLARKVSLSEREAISHKLNLDDLAAKLENTSNELLILKTQHDKSIKEFNFECDRLKAMLGLTNKELDSKTSELSNLNRGFDQKVEELERRIDEKTFELAKVQNSFETTHACFEAELAKLKAENEILQDQETFLSGQIIDLQAENKQYKLELERVKSVTESTSGQFTIELEKLKEENGKQLESLSASHADLKAQVEASEIEKKQISEDLKRSAEDLAKFEVVARAKDKEIQLAKDELDQFKKERSEAMARIASLEAELEGKKKENANLQANFEDISSKQLQETKDFYAKWEQEKAQTSRMETELKDKASEMSKVVQEKIRAEDSLAEKESILNSFQTEYQKKSRELQVMTEKSQNNEQQLKEITESFEKLNAEKQQLEENYKKLEVEFSKGFTTKQREYETIIAQKSSEIARLTNDYNNATITLNSQVRENSTIFLKLFLMI